MLCNPKLEMWEFSPTGIFDIRETELITGEPRNSLYLMYHIEALQNAYDDIDRLISEKQNRK